MSWCPPKRRILAKPTALLVGAALTVAASFGTLALSGCTGGFHLLLESHRRDWEKFMLCGQQALESGKWQAAAAFFRQALSQARASDCPPDTIANTQRLLGSSLVRGGSLGEASDCFSAALQKYAEAERLNQLDGFDRFNKGECLSGLADTLLQTGKLQQAQDTYNKALAEYVPSAVDDGLELHRLRSRAICMAGLAMTYRRLGNQQKADETFGNAIASLRGRGCPRVISELQRLQSEEDDVPASAPNEAKPQLDPQALQHAWEEAFNQYQDADRSGDRAGAGAAILKAYQLSKGFGENDLRHNKSTTELGTFYAIQSDWKQAIPVFLEEVQIKQRTFGTNDRALILPMNRLAMAYLHAGDLAKAEETAQAALAISDKTGGVTDCYPGRVYQTLSETYLGMNRLQDALKAAKDCEKIAKQTADHQTSCSILQIEAEIETKLGHLPAARQLLTEAVAIADDGLDYTYQFKAQSRLADTCYALHDLPAADRYYSQTEETLNDTMQNPRMRWEAASVLPKVQQAHKRVLEEQRKSGKPVRGQS